MLTVYTLARTEGATDTVEWEAICHSRQTFIMIHMTHTYERSRWVNEPRKRPFTVSHRKPGRVGWYDISHHATLAAAQKAARKYARSFVVA